MAQGRQNRGRRAARSVRGAGLVSDDSRAGAPLPFVGRDRDRPSGARSVMHALLLAPFETLGFMRTALVACAALALANGVVGTLLVLRRMSLDGDVLGHAVMPGAAIGFLYGGPSAGW